MSDNMSDNMSDKMDQYFEAYYGTPIPASQADVIRKPFVEMINTIRTDILNHIAYAKDDAVKAGLLEALRYMQSTGKVNSPTLYLQNTQIANEAFRYAIAATNGKPLRRDRSPKELSDALQRETEATRKMLAEQEAETNKLEGECPVSAALHREYHKVKTIHLKNGEEPRDAKVKAWMTLANAWQYQGGIDFMIVAHKIPMAEEIYNEIEVINTMKAHPQLCGMNRENEEAEKGMRINGQPWRGLEG